jgi:hypothetical protein
VVIPNVKLRKERKNKTICDEKVKIDFESEYEAEETFMN